MSRSRAAIIETFHLAFLTVLRTKVDPGRCVLKGGANLRYFFDSVRCSEDIDLDISGIRQWRLEEKIDGLLRSPQMKLLLRSSGLELDVDAVTKPKQTATTQRWKVPVLAADAREPVRTKIEFSARNGETRHAVDAVPPRIVERYGIAAPLVRHYLSGPAVEQKVKALAGRSETQARDVFDLDLLLRTSPLAAGAVDATTRKQAANRGLELPYQAFEDQIRPFLEPGAAALYDQDTWEQMQMGVADRLLAGDAGTPEDDDADR